MKRIDAHELLDEENAPREDMERSLRDLRRFNRYCGGIAVYRRLMRRMVKDRSRTLSLLDLGTATGDLPDSLRNYSNLHAVGLDFRIEHLHYLRDGSRARRVVGDAKHLPFRDRAVDVVTSAHFFHHFSPDENVEVLREALRVAKVGVIVNDTRRHVVPLLFVHLLGALHLVGRITRFDAPASVRRGYTPREAREIAQRAGALRAEVVRAFPFRFGILLWN